jgi:hypothetical protein
MPEQLNLIPDERDEIPDHVVLDGETLERWSRHRFAGAMDLAGADWHTLAEIVEALARFGGAHAEKKRQTVLALVEAELAGEPEEKVWKRPDTCSRSTYHARWKKNTQFTRTLALVRDIARKYAAAQPAAAMIRARRTMQLGTAPAADRTVRELDSEDGNIALKAAKIIIDATKLFDDEQPSDPNYAIVINNSASAAAGYVSLDEWIARQAAAQRQAEAAEDLLDLYYEEDAGDAGEEDPAANADPP